MIHYLVSSFLQIHSDMARGGMDAAEAGKNRQKRKKKMKNIKINCKKNDFGFSYSKQVHACVQYIS